VRLILFPLIILIFSCNNENVSEYKELPDKIYLNHNDTVQYLGKETCKQCHSEIYNSFMQTGMGQSFSHATKIKSVLDENNNPLIYDENKNLYYQPIWKKDSLYIMEFRLDKYDTIHKLIQKIDFVIGSGQHTNSHIFSINGYLHQAPYTFYTQEEKGDLPPGYENGNNSRFTREIGLECMSCHNAYSKHVENSINQYHSVPDGIDCERCHGPGEIHVQQKLSGNIIDTSKYIDYTIVNPSKLSSSLQFDICRRCHLQGTSVLQNGKNWNDFIPGTVLSETMDTYIPRYENDESFIMASHVDRLQQSDCFKVGGVSCISCHNPHKSVTSLDNNHFNNKCVSCHSNCEETPKNTDCISCHMPKSSSIDIPHVSITDHKISVHSNSKKVKGSFKELACINNDSPTNLSKAKAYLKHYESFDQNPMLLDSAFMFLKRCKKEESFPFYVQYYYLKKDYKKLIKYSEYYSLDELHNIFTSNVLSITYSRIADSYSKYNFNEKSYANYLKSVELSPNNLDFLLKTSVLEIKMFKFEQAKIRLQKVIKFNPNFEKAYYNLGLIYLNVDQDLYLAKLNFEEALKLNPDYIQAKDMLKYIENN
tara:strand:- start:3683 stop:5464 length:1782 start_codon:yes stop_codon:yes gene_type:complete